MSKFKLVGASHQQVKITPKVWMVYRDDPKNNTITVPGTRDAQFQPPMWELIPTKEPPKEKKKKTPKKEGKK